MNKIAFALATAIALGIASPVLAATDVLQETQLDPGIAFNTTASHMPIDQNLDNGLKFVPEY